MNYQIIMKGGYLMNRYPAALSNELIKNIESTELCDGLAIPIMAYRIKYLLVSLIRPDTEEFEEIELTLDEFKEYFEISSWGGNQQDALEYAISMLRGSRYSIDGHEITWLDLESDIDGKNIRLCLHESLTPYLIGLTGRFTKIYYNNIKNLKSKYAFRLYELLSSMKGVGKYKLYLKNAYKTIGDDNYTTKSEFLAHVVDPALEEINKHTDLTVSYSFEKSFGVPEQIVFEINSSKVFGKTPASKPVSKPSTTKKTVAPKKSAVVSADGDSDLIPIPPAEANNLIDDDFLEMAKEFIE